MASRTEEAFRAWLGRLRGLNSPAEAAKNVNVMLPLFRLDPDGGADSKKGHNASAAKDARSNPSPTVSAATPPASVSPPEKGIISYSDLKLGLLIKDQELLKLILKALRWAENDRRASFEVLIQRLKNSSFREILSNRNLLNDSDLTQLLKSYIGQGVMNSFAAMPPPAASTPLNNNHVVPPAVMFQPPINPTGGVKSGNQSGFLAPVGPIAGVNVNEYRIDEASVTQMEVGVDPDLYLPYEDEDSSSTNKFEGRIEDRQENTVTIKLVTTNVAGDMIENKRMIPAILNVRGNKRFQCSACPECFETNGELQQHIVRRHLPRTNRTVITEQGKPAIKIRVRKNKPIAGPLLPPKLISPSAPGTLTATTPSPTVPTRDSGGVTVTESSSPIKIVPLKIPASTTITVIPATPPPTTTVPVEPNKPPTVEQKVEVKPPPIKKEPPSTSESPAKAELLVRKSKRKTSLKPEVSSLILEKQQKKRKVQQVVQKPVQKEAQTPAPPAPPPPAPPSPKPKTSRKSNAFCALCRKRLTPKQTMRVHMQQEHSRYECEKCDRAFKSAMNLSRHQQYHASSSSTVPTELASSSAGTKRAQKAANPPPQQEEEKEQTHKCSYCEKAFKRSHHLKLHLKHHKKDATSAGSGLRRRSKLNQSSSSGSAIKSVLVSSTAESGQGSKTRKMEATKRKSTITRKVRFSC
ncbi:proteoglycan 4-like isoform X2 [Anopheles merus]|nr:proteoglycan 4-like isoform X2 [Anopheles merus]XP_041778433.1 proteoglycan 4-like isoform X2 [Anopheles merus]XP_041778434.1 proteoglycan 4-like isoform X2 [Anopheles merus]